MANRPGPDVGRSRPVLSAPAVGIGLGVLVLLAGIGGLLAGRTLAGVLLGIAGVAVVIFAALRAAAGQERPPDEGIL